MNHGGLHFNGLNLLKGEGEEKALTQDGSSTRELYWKQGCDVTPPQGCDSVTQ